MADINAMIAQGAQPVRLESPINMMAQLSQLQAAQGANQLRQMQMEQAMRQQEQQNALQRRLATGAPLTSQEALLGGAPAMAAFEFQRGQEEKDRLERERKQSAIAEGLLMVKDNPTLENFSQAFRFMKERGYDMGPTAAEIMTMTDEQRKNAVNQFIGTTPGMAQRLAELEKIGAQTGQARAAAGASLLQQQKTGMEIAGTLPMTPYQRESLLIQERKLNAERKTELEKLQTLRDSLPVGSSARAEVDARIDALGRPAAPTMDQIIDPADPTRMLRIDVKTYRGGSLGAPGVVGVAGKEPAAGKRAAERLEGEEQFRDILDKLRTSFDDLNRMRAIPSEQRGAVSNILSAAEASSVGQVAGRALGAKAQTLRDEIASSRMMLMSALKKLTGKSASELNSNVELRLNLNAISDPSQSYEAAIKIINNLEDVYVRGKAGAAPATATAPSAPKEVNFGDLK